MPGPYTWILNQNIFFFNIALEKIENNLANKKLQDIMKLVAMSAKSLVFRLRLIIATIGFNKDDYIGKISNKMKILAFQFLNLS